MWVKAYIYDSFSSFPLFLLWILSVWKKSNGFKEASCPGLLRPFAFFRHCTLFYASYWKWFYNHLSRFGFSSFFSQICVSLDSFFFFLTESFWALSQCQDLQNVAYMMDFKSGSLELDEGKFFWALRLIVNILILWDHSVLFFSAWWTLLWMFWDHFYKTMIFCLPSLTLKFSISSVCIPGSLIVLLKKKIQLQSQILWWE